MKDKTNEWRLFDCRCLLLTSFHPSRVIFKAGSDNWQKSQITIQRRIPKTNFVLERLVPYWKTLKIFLDSLVIHLALLPHLSWYLLSFIILHKVFFLKHSFPRGIISDAKGLEGVMLENLGSSKTKPLEILSGSILWDLDVWLWGSWSGSSVSHKTKEWRLFWLQMFIC